MPTASLAAGILCLVAGLLCGYRYSPAFYVLCPAAPVFLLAAFAISEIEDHGTLLVFKSVFQKSTVRKQDVVGFDFIPGGKRCPFFRLSTEGGRCVQITILTESAKLRIGGFLSRALYGSAR